MQYLWRSLFSFLSIWIATALCQAQIFQPGGPADFFGHRGLQISLNQVLPQIAVGRDISTSLVLMRLDGTGPVTPILAPEARLKGVIHFFRPDGTPLRVAVNGRGTESSFPFELNSSQMLSLELTSDGPNTAGWALVELGHGGVEGPTGGFVDGIPFFRGQLVQATAFYTVWEDEEKMASRVGVLPSVYELGRFFSSVLVAQSSQDVDTGVAVVNVGPEAAEIELRLKNAAGEVVAEQTLTLEGGHQIARFLSQLFPKELAGDFQGRLEVFSRQEGVVTLGLLSSQGILTSIPTHHFGIFAVARP